MIWILAVWFVFGFYIPMVVGAALYAKGWTEIFATAIGGFIGLEIYGRISHWRDARNWRKKRIMSGYLRVMRYLKIHKRNTWEY